jgi:hypothetical protein
VHDARHQDVSNFNKLLDGPTQDDTSVDEEGNAANADFEALAHEKAVEASAPTVYSFADGDRTSASKGFGRPYDTKTEGPKSPTGKKARKALPRLARQRNPGARKSQKNVGVDPDVASVHGFGR